MTIGFYQFAHVIILVQVILHDLCMGAFEHLLLIVLAFDPT